MEFRFSEIDPKIRYKLLSATVTPRPIAWVSTLDEAGRTNAAPFSFFNAFGEDPAVVGFSILHRSHADPKDTGRNISRSGEFVVNLVSDDNLEQMNLSAIEFGPDVDEFAVAGLTAVPSALVKPPRIGESKVAFECRLMQTVKLGEMRSLVLGEVLLMHIQDGLVIDPERGWIDTRGLRLIGRTSAASYVRTNEIMNYLLRPPKSGGAGRRTGARYAAETERLRHWRYDKTASIAACVDGRRVCAYGNRTVSTCSRSERLRQDSAADDLSTGTEKTMAKYKYCTVSDEGRLRIVTLNRPEVMNALHSDAHDELETVWDEFSASDDLWLAIITGAGDRAFSAGNDLKSQAAGKRTGLVRSGFAGITHRFDLDKPLIAAVNGIAMGGGFEIALSCDIIVAAENAVFALPEPRVGLIAGAGGVHRLPRIIPQKEALGMILTGRRVSAAEGRELGFVNEVVGVGQALSAAKRWAGLILECSPKAIRASKQSYFRGLEEPNLESAMRKIYPAHQENKESLDYIEGPKAFAEKRKPNWQNK